MCVFYKYSQQKGTKKQHVYHLAQYLLAEDYVKHGYIKKQFCFGKF